MVDGYLAAGHCPSKVARHKDQLPTNPQANQACQVGAAPEIVDIKNNGDFSIYYPKLYPTPSNNISRDCANGRRRSGSRPQWISIQQGQVVQQLELLLQLWL